MSKGKGRSSGKGAGGIYDGARQRPLFDGKETYRSAKTVVIDEASMLTMDDLYAVLQALDLTHVQRLILVGETPARVSIVVSLFDSLDLFHHRNDRILTLQRYV